MGKRMQIQNAIKSLQNEELDEKQNEEFDEKQKPNPGEPNIAINQVQDDDDPNYKEQIKTLQHKNKALENDIKQKDLKLLETENKLKALQIKLDEIQNAKKGNQSNQFNQ